MHQYHDLFKLFPLPDQKPKTPKPKKRRNSATGNEPTMSKSCNTPNNSSSTGCSQLSLNSGPAKTVTITTFASPSPQAATVSHRTEGVQRSSHRPSSQAATGAQGRALNAQSTPADISRNTHATPSESARARAVSRFQSATSVQSSIGESASSESDTLSASIQLTNTLLNNLIRAPESKSVE